MELSLQQLVVHQITKPAAAPAFELALSEQDIPVDERSYALLEQLHRTFEQKNDRLHGRLADPGDALFPAYLESWRQATDGFIQFSRQTMQALELSLQGVTGAKGGYLVYAHYQTEAQEYLGIFLVRDTQGLVFRHRSAEATFEIDETTYLHTDRLAMAVRIRLDRLEAEAGRFVELIKHQRSQSGISDYFVQWVGLEETTTSRAQTETFLELVEQLPLPVDQETGTPMAEEEFQGLVVEYAQKAPQKTINLQAFDETFYESKPTARRMVEEQEMPLDTEFQLDRAAFKRHFQHKISAGGITLYFNRQHLQRGQVQLDGDEIRFIDAELVEQMRLLLEED